MMTDRRCPAPETPEGRLVAVETRLGAVEDAVKDVKSTLVDIAKLLNTALLDKADWQAVKELGEQVTSKADASELHDLRSRLPLWVTWAMAAMASVIGSLLTALYFVLTFLRK